MSEYTIFEILPGSRIECEKEAFGHGNVFVARDRRETYIVIGQRLEGVREAIANIIRRIPNNHHEWSTGDHEI